MPSTPPHEDPAARTARAVAAATAAGHDLGLTVREPQVLHDLFSVIVHLAPSPVVVRVPTVLPYSSGSDLAAQATRQRAELSVAGWLSEQGYPVVPPSPLTPCEPVQRDGFSMTCWQFVERDTTTDTPWTRKVGWTADLHAAMRDYPGELAFLSTVDSTLPDSLTMLEKHPGPLDSGDLDRAWREYATLEPVLRSREQFEAEFPDAPAQPIHGDSPPYNLIHTPTGPLYSDFELTMLGPAEWDIALAGADGEAAYNDNAQRVGLRQLDNGALRVVEAFGLLQNIACLALVPQLPILEDALKPMVEHWRTAPFAGGLTR